MANLSSRNQQVRQSSAPISAGKAGFIQQYAGTSAPSGWLECSGQAVSRTDYAQLFANVGTKYGVGDGSTTFNLPDGPRRTNEVDLSLSSTPTGWSPTTATGHLEQSAEGQLYLHFLIQGAYTTSTGNQSITIDGISASINGQAVACMGEASAGYNAFFNSGVITMYTGGTGTNDLRVQGRIIIDSASDTFVSADADYSTLSEAWESIPIIKLYDDVADAVSVGVAEATASELGTVKTADSYYHSYTNAGSIAVGTLESISITKPGKYLVLFSATFAASTSNSSRGNQVNIEHEATIIAQSFTQVANTDAASDYGTGTAHVIVDLAASDTLDFKVTSVGSTTIQAYSITISPMVLTSNTSDSVGTVT